MEIRRILAPVDFTECSRLSLNYAIRLADTFDASIDVLHAWTGTLDLSASEHVARRVPLTIEVLARTDSKRKMERFLERVARPEGVELHDSIEFDRPVSAIRRRARGCDLVVMGTHGRTGIERLVMGSVAEKVVGVLANPVVTIPDCRGAKERTRALTGDVPIRRVLVAVDFSDCSKQAVRYAEWLKNKLGAHLEYLHVAPGPPALYGADYLAFPYPEQAREPFEESFRADALRKTRQFLEETAGVDNPTISIDFGSPSATIMDYARIREPDLIIMGTHGRRGFSGFFVGSVARRVMRHASCPVLTLREPAPSPSMVH